MRTARRSIMEHLKAHGEATVASLAVVTGLAAVTVRHHMSVLRDAGHVEFVTLRAGRGRPRHVYRLTASGCDTLSNGHAAQGLAADLLSALERDAEGRAASVMRDIATESATASARALADAPLGDRVRAAIGLLEVRGFTMRLEPSGTGFLVVDLGCPYERVSRENEAVCCLDLEIMRLVSGVEVTRDQWRLDGHPACVFRVRGEEPAAP